MRSSDIMQDKPSPTWVKTPGMYMPAKTSAAEMCLENVMLGLCYRVQTQPDVCLECGAPCRFGLRYLELMGRTGPRKAELRNAT